MRFTMTLPTILLGLGLCCLIAVSPARSAGQAKPSPQQPEKKSHRVLGEIPFSYDYGETLVQARKNAKPIFAYFTYDG